MLLQIVAGVVLDFLRPLRMLLNEKLNHITAKMLYVSPVHARRQGCCVQHRRMQTDLTPQQIPTGKATLLGVAYFYMLANAKTADVGPVESP